MDEINHTTALSEEIKFLNKIIYEQETILQSVVLLLTQVFLSVTEQQDSSASSLHLSHWCVLQCCEERPSQHHLPGTQESVGSSAQVLTYEGTNKIKDESRFQSKKRNIIAKQII